MVVFQAFSTSYLMVAFCFLLVWILLVTFSICRETPAVIPVMSKLLALEAPLWGRNMLFHWLNILPDFYLFLWGGEERQTKDIRICCDGLSFLFLSWLYNNHLPLGFLKQMWYPHRQLSVSNDTLRSIQWFMFMIIFWCHGSSSSSLNFWRFTYIPLLAK